MNPNKKKDSTHYKRHVLAVHDISCIGRCSLTVALPIISAYGLECSVLPTTLLSTHTGGFTGFTCLNLTAEMEKIIKAWQPLSLSFSAIYSGFMADAKQIEVLKNLIAKYKTEDSLVIIDPVMADNGQLYKIFNLDFVKTMKQLVSYCDVLIPNITEACFLTDTKYEEGPHSEKFLYTLTDRLIKMGAKNIVLTGVETQEENLGVMVFNGSEYSFYSNKKIQGYYHGTGDIFGSVLTAALVNRDSLIDAAARAADFVVEAIKQTDKNADKKYGVDFEKVLAKVGGKK